MSSDNGAIHTFWHGGELPPLAHACLQSFLVRGHTLRVHCYQPIDAPAGTTLEDAREVVALDDPMYRFSDSSTITAFADYFRYKLLHQRGGWWVDTDVYCLTDALPDEAYAWAEQESGVINNAILKFPKGDPLCGRLAALAKSRAHSSMRWGALGPDLTTEVLGPSDAVDPADRRSAFYPIHWLEAHFLWLPEFKDVVAKRAIEAKFIHCWAKVLDNMGIDMWRSPPAGSFLSDMLRQTRQASGSSVWHRFKTRRSIQRYLQQRWVKEYWVTRVGRSWNDLARTPANHGLADSSNA